MAEAHHVDQRTLRRVEAEGQSVSDSDYFPAKPERIFSEDVNVHWRVQRGNASAARDCDVNAIGDEVSEAVTGEGGNETERALRNTVSDLQKVVIGRWRIGPPIQAAAHLLKMSLIAVAVEALRGEPGDDSIRVSKDGR